MLYDLTNEGLGAHPFAVLSPHVEEIFASVHLAHGKLITSEASRGSKVLEVVVRDSDRPLGPPLLVLRPEPLPHPKASRPSLACGIGLAAQFQARIAELR